MLKPTLNLSKNINQTLAKLALVSTIFTVANHSAAQALNFNFTYSHGTSLDQMIAFEAAGDVWSAYFTDDITLNIHIGVTDLLPENVVGGAIPGFINDQDYQLFYNALNADKTSQNDITATSNIDALEYDARVGNLTLRDIDKIDITRANAKAVGLRDADDKSLDAYILMSDLSGVAGVEWNYNLNSAVASNQLDFYSVAIHEIGHALGFVSGADNKETFFQEISSAIKEEEEELNIVQVSQYGIEKPLNNVLDNNDALYSQLVTDYNANNYDLNPATSLDLFRQSSATQSDTDMIDLSLGVDSFFAIDKSSQLAYFSTGEDTTIGGDGYQASHWKNQDNPLGIMAPTIGLGERREIKELDLIALDVIGFDRTQTNPTIDLSQIASDVTSRIGNGKSLIKNNDNKVMKMIEESEIYQWGWGSGGGNNCDPNTQNCGNSQLLAEILTNEALFNQAYFSTLNIDTKSAEVPESSPMTALLGLSLVGVGGLVKGKSSNK